MNYHDPNGCYECQGQLEQETYVLDRKQSLKAIAVGTLVGFLLSVGVMVAAVLAAP